MKPLEENSFAAELLAWFDLAAREMPWRSNRDPYRIWVSEIMLQQTQIKTAIPYFNRFIAAFPTVQDLAEAPLERVLKLWEGLGYYSRARNLHRGAQYVLVHCGGVIPDSPELIRQIPGIGPYSAGAILSIAFDLPEPAVDGNVIRVMSRIDAIATPFDTSASRRALETRVRGLIPARAGDFNQALMELGALICSPQKPACPECPLRSHCQAYARGQPESYPAKVKKTKVRIVQLAVAMVRDPQGRVLVQQQAETGLFRKLWCLPWIELEPSVSLEQAAGALLPLLPLAARVQGHLATVSHTLTHRQLEMAVYVCCSVGSCPDMPSDWAWIDPAHNPDHAVPVAHQKILNYAAEHPLLLQMYSRA